MTAMNQDVVIRVENLVKEYRLGSINHGMLYKDVQSWWARLRGKDDPNARIDDQPMKDEDKARMRGDRFRALNDVSFQIKRGEVLGVIGKNGAGKSTLLKVLSRTTAPTAGTVRVRGRIASLLEVGTGFHPELTGRENVFLNGAILGMRKKEIAARFDEITEFAEIGKFIDTPVKRYSSGMYVRLAFAVAAHLDPEILVIDEVLAVGDLSFQRKCIGKMDLVRKEGRTVMFVSHNLTAINQLCGRCILLNGGKLVAQGASADVVSTYVQMNKLAQQAEKTYPFPAGDKPAGIRRVAVMKPSGEVSGEVAMNSEFIVHIEYQLARQVAGLMVGMQLIADEGNQAVVMVNDAELDLSLLEARATGIYSGRVRVPGNLLNSGSYQVRVGVSTRYGVIDVSEDVNVTVTDTVGIVQPLGWERKNSILSMQLPWETRRVAAT